MKFKDFFIQNYTSNNTPNENFPVATTANKLNSLTLKHLTPNESVKLADEIIKIATSKEFISELDSEIESPNDTESKDEFVERACEVLKKNLIKLFDKK